MYEQILEQKGHRSSPLPKGPWIMTQKWDNLLFIHLPIEKEKVESYLPECLSIDTFKGEAWITILPFEVNDMHLRGLPTFPSVHTYLELNVRTYVKRNGVAGLYFFSLDASKILAVIGARTTSLPYYYAGMDMDKKGEEFQFYSKRKSKTGALLQGSYRPLSEVYIPKEDSLEYWLLERYYAWSPFGRYLVEVGIHHTRWEIQQAEAAIQSYNLTPFTYKEMAKDAPLFHYSPSKRALFWPVKLIKQRDET